MVCPGFRKYYRGGHLIGYRAVLDIPWDLFWYVHALLERRRVQVGTRRGRRALSVYAQTRLVLRRLRDCPDYANLARELGISVSTVQRMCTEGVEALAAQAPDLDDLIARILREGWPYVIADGLVVPTDKLASYNVKMGRLAKLSHIRGEEAEPVPDPQEPAAELLEASTDPPQPPLEGEKLKHAEALVERLRTDGRRSDPSYSGKHRLDGMNLQVIASPLGDLLWISEAATGRTHDSTAVKTTGLPQALAEAGITVLADLAYGSVPGWKTMFKRPAKGKLTGQQVAFNTFFAPLRAPVERAIWTLTGHWRILRHNPGDPHDTATTARACLTLHLWLAPNRPSRHTAY